MGKLKIERLKPAPSWTYTALDQFELFKIKDEVKKRTTGKANGIIFNCLGTRAPQIDISTDYSTGTARICVYKRLSTQDLLRQLFSMVLSFYRIESDILCLLCQEPDSINHRWSANNSFLKS